MGAGLGGELMTAVVHMVFVVMVVWALVVPWLWGQLRPGGRLGRLGRLQVLTRRWWLGMTRRLGLSLGLDERGGPRDGASSLGRSGLAAASARPVRGWARLAAGVVGACLVAVAWSGTLAEAWGTTDQGDVVQCGASVVFLLEVQAEWDALVAHGCVFHSRVAVALLVAAGLLVLRAQRWALGRLAGGAGGSAPTPQ